MHAYIFMYMKVISLEISFIFFPVLSTQFFMIKMKCWACRYYSEIKITGCPSIGTVFISQHPHDWLSTTYNSKPREPWALFCPPQGTRHPYGTDTYMQTKHSEDKFKKKTFKKMKWHLCIEISPLTILLIHNDSPLILISIHLKYYCILEM